jgi:hypothetical protein
MSSVSTGSCPDWSRLSAARDAAPGDPPGWDDALRHLDGCARCRHEAVAADALLAFRRLRVPDLAVDEAEAMRLRVAALRGAGRLGPSRRRLPLRQAAAAAVVALAALAGGSAPPLATEIARTLPVVAAPVLDAALASEPVLDSLEQPFEHVVQWNGDDLSVVLVVDGRLGV